MHEERLALDITDRERAQAALREGEERFRGTFENAAVGIFHNDPAGRFLRVNDKYCDIVGYSPEELLQKSLQDIIHPEELAAHIALYASSFTRGESPAGGMERRYHCKDGRAVWVEVFASCQRDAFGRPVYAIAIVQDISERKRIEGELRQTTALLQGFADGTQDAVYVKDIEGRHLMFNAAWSTVYAEGGAHFEPLLSASTSPNNYLETPVMSSGFATNVLDALDQLAGGIHPGFRPVHARGVMYCGTFTPSAEAAQLTRAPHATRPSTAVTVRFSLASGIPTVADNDPLDSSPQAMAIRFHLADHVHTDIIAHSVNGFPVRTGEEFLEFIRAASASQPGGPTPPPIVAFLAAHPTAKAFVEAPKPIPSSFARQSYFAITAFKFTNAAGQSRFGRFRIHPEAGTEFLTTEQSAKKTADFLAAELSERLSRGPAGFRVVVQLAESGDNVTDSTAVWPEDRPQVEFGTVAIKERVDELAPERRKIIFDPVPRVDGIDSAGDPLTAARSDIYLLSGRRRRTAAAA
jgi:catalase